MNKKIYGIGRITRKIVSIVYILYFIFVVFKIYFKFSEIKLFVNILFISLKISFKLSVPYLVVDIKSYLDKAASVFQGRKRDSINHVRQAFNEVIENDRGLKLPEYIKYLHSLAVKADKKSQVNKTPTKDSTSSWHHIKKVSYL